MQFSYYKITSYITLCGAVRLCHFVGGFGVIFAVWLTPLDRGMGEGIK